MSDKIQRIVILVIAVVFTVSTFGVVGFYIYDARNQSKQAEIQAGLVEAQKQLNAQQQTNNPEEKKLEGTQLQNFTPGASITELKYDDIVPGTGAEITSASKITVHYTGALASTGKIFQSSLDTGKPYEVTDPNTGQPIPFAQASLIQGWLKGVPGMKEGGTRRLYIPAALGYGSSSQGNIPANSDLVFDIQAVKVN